jgi:hypothetical protein
MPDGRMLVNNIGRQRFKILEVLDPACAHACLRACVPPSLASCHRRASLRACQGALCTGNLPQIVHALFLADHPTHLPAQFARLALECLSICLPACLPVCRWLRRSLCWCARLSI